MRVSPLLAALSLAGVALAPGTVRAQSRNVQLYAHLHNYPRYSACWSYVHSDGREYAILGTQNGTSIVNVTNPAASYEVEFIPGRTSVWREMKQYRDYVYISTEADSGGIQIVKMTDPENPVLVNTYVTGFNRAHTVEVDSARALLYCNGTRLGVVATGMRILSLADPENPTPVGSYTGDYVHDCFPSGNRLYASCIVSHYMRVLDVTDPAAPFEIAAWTYPGATTHSGETTVDGRYLYICDEANYGTMKIFDIDNLSLPVQVDEVIANPLAIAHNIHIKGSVGYLAYYTEGVRLLDLADPALPAEFGFYDTYPDFSGGFNGVWEVAPFFPSGTFIVSDIQTGLYVFRATPNYGIVKVLATDASSAPISGADVFTLDGAGSTSTRASGQARLALDPGQRTLRVSKFGYEPVSIPITTTVGSSDSFAVTLTASPAEQLSGIVRRSGDLASLPNALVELVDTPLETVTGVGGGYLFSSVPVGSYVAFCERAGYAPQSRVVPVAPGPGVAMDWNLLPAAWYDSCDTNRGWSPSAPGDNATAGLWVRAEPVGTSNAPAPAPYPAPALAPSIGAVGAAAQHPEPEEGGALGPVQPDDDHTPGAGGFCFVTGNGSVGGGIADADVDGGKTTLTTPAFDLSGMGDPIIGFQRWYFMSTPNEPDAFVVDITADGVSWVNVLTTTASHPEWHHELIRVSDYMVPSAAVRLRFVAQDFGLGGVVEAGIDDLEVHDDALVPATASAAGLAPAVTLGAPRPNPTSRGSSITLHLGSPAHARVAVYDVAGREVAKLFEGRAASGDLRLKWSGVRADGGDAPAGVYWIRAAAAGRVLARKQVLLR